MKSGKLILSLSLILGLAVVFLAACGGGKSASPAKGGEKAKEEAKSSTPAEKFPSKPIKIYVHSAPGGSTDILTRGVAPYLEKNLGVPIVVENMPDAGGRKARDVVFTSPPDGYNLILFLTPSAQTGQVMYETKYDVAKFTYIYNVFGNNYKAIGVAMDSPYKTFKDLVDASQKKPLNIGGGGGVGSSSHLQSVLLANKANLKHAYVPFDGTAEVTVALLGHKIDAAVNDMVGLIRSRDKIRVLAVHAPVRQKGMEDVPTLEELGYKGLVIPWMVGYAAAPGLPKDRPDVLVKAFEKASKDPDFIQWSEKSGFAIEALGPEEFKKVALESLEQIKSVGNLLKEGSGKGK